MDNAETKDTNLGSPPDDEEDEGPHKSVFFTAGRK